MLTALLPFVEKLVTLNDHSHLTTWSTRTTGQIVMEYASGAAQWETARLTNDD